MYHLIKSQSLLNDHPPTVLSLSLGGCGLKRMWKNSIYFCGEHGLMLYLQKWGCANRVWSRRTYVLVVVSKTNLLALRDYVAARLVWGEVDLADFSTFYSSSTCAEWIRMTRDYLSDEVFNFFANVAWFIWFSRNQVLYGELCYLPRRLVEMSKSYYLEFLAAIQVGSLVLLPHCIIIGNFIVKIC